MDHLAQQEAGECSECGSETESGRSCLDGGEECCEDCAHFHAPSGRCIHEFPNEEHRRAYYEAPGDWIVFCKDFDLR